MFGRSKVLKTWKPWMCQRFLKGVDHVSWFWNILLRLPLLQCARTMIAFSVCSHAWTRKGWGWSESFRCHFDYLLRLSLFIRSSLFLFVKATHFPKITLWSLVTIKNLKSSTQSSYSLVTISLSFTLPFSIHKFSRRTGIPGHFSLSSPISFSPITQQPSIWLHDSHSNVSFTDNLHPNLLLPLPVKFQAWMNITFPALHQQSKLLNTSPTPLILRTF